MSAPSTTTSGSDLFIVDNSDEYWRVLNCLSDWCDLSKSIDIATGYFEIGAFLALKDVSESSIEKSLPHLNSGFVSRNKYNCTDLQRWDEKALREMELTLWDADVILIDEAQNFRNPGVAGTGATEEPRYRRFQRLLHQERARAKQLFSLTPTRINNSINDFRHILELVTNKD
jgi:hypothetical protein